MWETRYERSTGSRVRVAMVMYLGFMSVMLLLGKCNTHSNTYNTLYSFNSRNLLLSRTHTH